MKNLTIMTLTFLVFGILTTSLAKANVIGMKMYSCTSLTNNTDRFDLLTNTSVTVFSCYQGGIMYEITKVSADQQSALFRLSLDGITRDIVLRKNSNSQVIATATDTVESTNVQTNAQYICQGL
jgi:hypothetical protein